VHRSFFRLFPALPAIGMIMISITYDAADGFFVSNHIGRTAFSAIAKAAAAIGILILGTDSLRLAQAVRELLAASTAIFFFAKCRNEYCGLYYAA
jgi:hypothetical protein